MPHYLKTLTLNGLHSPVAAIILKMHLIQQSTELIINFNHIKRNKMETTRLLFRWGVWMCYSEWKPDQPEENWNGQLSINKGQLQSPNMVIYHGCFGPQHRTLIPLETPKWTSRIDYPRPSYGYKGLEGLQVDVQGDEDTCLTFKSNMIDVQFCLKDIKEQGKLVWDVGSKYSCSQLLVCPIEDEGVYWNDRLLASNPQLAELNAKTLGLELFKGSFLKRAMHHQISAWIPPNGTVNIPFKWDSLKPAIATWHFTGAYWGALSETYMSEYFSGHNSPTVKCKTELDGIELSNCQLKAKYMRGSNSALEHTDELGILDSQEHTLSVTNLSDNNTYLVLHQPVIQEKPANWSLIKKCLPFQPIWSTGRQQLADFSQDVPTDGQGILIGYDTNMMAAENGWIDAAISYLANTNDGNYILFRTETDQTTKEDWQRWFTACRDNGIFFTVNPGILLYAVEQNRLSTEEILALAIEIGGKYFLGAKSHEVSIPIYSGWENITAQDSTNLKQAEESFLKHIQNSYVDAGENSCKNIIGEAMLAHRYDYKAGVELILSETMTGNNSLLLAEARGAAKAYNRKLWGMHIACHVNATPEDWRHERMFWINLYSGYLSGASIIEDEEGGLAKVHSFVSGPSDPLPQARQKTIADFHKWACDNPRKSELQVEIGFIYGRHEIITGGLSINTQRPVRIWESFGPDLPQWQYGQPEYGWLLMDIFMPGVWMCPILRDKENLRRWFAGTPHGQVDIVPVEAELECLTSYKLLVMPGWHTMTESDMAKLTEYVAQGGMLVMGLSHLQNSNDRTQVLSSDSWSFVSNESIGKLCGFELKQNCPYKTFDATAKMQGSDSDQKTSFKIMDVALTSGLAVTCNENMPFLVENKIGKGRVFTCTAMEHFGHRYLLSQLKMCLEELLCQIDFDVYLQDNSNEVMYFTYSDGNKKEVFLINTDWTTEGNVKKCHLLSQDGSKTEIEVEQGKVTKVIL